MRTLILFLITFFSTLLIYAQPKGTGSDPAAGMRFGITSVTNPSSGNSYGYLVAFNLNINNNSRFTYIPEINYSKSKINRIDQNHLKFPLVARLNLGNHLHIGTGIEYSYLLGVNDAGRKVIINSNPNYNRNGIGLLFDVEAGLQNRGPNLGLRYITRNGAGIINTRYETLELSLRIKFGKK